MSKGYKFKKFQEPTLAENQGIWPHNHCKVCNRITPPRVEYCSEACKNIHDQKELKEKKSTKKRIFLTIGFSIVAVVALVILIIFSSMNN